MKDLFTHRLRSTIAAGLAVVGCAAVSAAPAAAAIAPAPPEPKPTLVIPATTTLDTASCVNPQLSQPFMSLRDSHWYTMLPGETPGAFTGSGWILGNGAHAASATLADGSAGSVLDMPSGSYAVSPAMCVTTAYPTARVLVRDIVGAEGVQTFTSYEGTPSWTKPLAAGTVHGTGTSWTTANPFNLHPYNTPGWQIVRFVFVAGGKTSDFQLSDLWIDPRMKI